MRLPTTTRIADVSRAARWARSVVQAANPSSAVQASRPSTAVWASTTTAVQAFRPATPNAAEALRPRRLGKRLLVPSLILAAIMAGCQQVADLTNPDSVAGDWSAGSASDAAFCAAEINRLRATVGLRPLAQSQTVETFSNTAARIDSAAHEEHKHFRETNGGGGVVGAENEIPWWNLSEWGSVQAVIREGLAVQWSEGPGGVHYDNMTGGFSQTACGISIRNREVTVTQDFR